MSQAAGTEHAPVRLKIAYLCDHSPKLTWSHSGGNTRLYNALQKHVGDVTILSNSWGAVNCVRKLVEKLPLSINLRARFRIHLLLSRIIARHVAKELAKGEYDVLFCPYAYFCLANLKLPYPIVTVFSSDSTYWAYKYSKVGAAFGSFFSFSRMFDSAIFRAEREVYRSTDLCLWPSSWIKRSADTLYGLSESQSHMVHWGANIAPPDESSLRIQNPITDEVKLLLVGRDWVPKGGPAVVKILLALQSQGVRAHLTVVGCTPPESDMHENMTVYPQLNKEDPSEYATFTNLYRTSHLFVMPSYEAYGFAFCEASAYGLPSICLDVGGVPVKDGVNGRQLPDGASTEDFVKIITEYTNNAEKYQALRESTRGYYEEHLHWDAWGRKTRDLMIEAISKTSVKSRSKSSSEPNPALEHDQDERRHCG